MDLFIDKNVKPMLLHETEKPFNDKDYIFELKFDGTRTLIYVSPKEIIIKNKRGFILNDTYPELLNIKNMVKKKCIFDGEIILMDNGLPSFKKLQERALLKDKIKISYYKDNFPVTFVCFDILYEDKNLIDLSLIERKKILSKYPDIDYFVKSRITEENGIELFNITRKMDLEGIVAKKKDSKYLINKRSKDWLKIKNLKEADFYIGAYKEEKIVASLVLCQKIKNKLKFVSKVTIGKKRNDFKLIKSCKSTNNNFIDFNEDGYTYIIPKYKCTVLFVETTKNGHLRQPTFKSIRID